MKKNNGTEIVNISNDFEKSKAYLKKKFPYGLKKVLLVTPPDGTEDLFQISTAKRRRYSNYPAYGLGLLAQYLRNINIEVSMRNLNHEILKLANLSKENVFNFKKMWQNKCYEKNYRDIGSRFV